MNAGRIVVIFGPMFSGKTEELLRRMRRAKIARKKIQLFKPGRDNRYHESKIVPHYLALSDHKEELGEQAYSVEDSQAILPLLQPDVGVVGIEEAQFFDFGLYFLINILASRGIDVVLSLLDKDFRRNPFPIPGSERNIGDYLARAHESVHLTAICVRCGQDAQYSQKLVFVNEYPQGKPVYVPASYFSETVVVGTGRDLQADGARYPTEVYEARCIRCHELPDEPDFNSLWTAWRHKSTPGSDI